MTVQKGIGLTVTRQNFRGAEIYPDSNKGSYNDDGSKGQNYSARYKTGFNQGYEGDVSPTSNPVAPPNPDSTVIPGPPPPILVYCSNSFNDNKLYELTFTG
jgi:hypothetical protein